MGGFVDCDADAAFEEADGCGQATDATADDSDVEGFGGGRRRRGRHKEVESEICMEDGVRSTEQR